MSLSALISLDFCGFSILARKNTIIATGRKDMSKIARLIIPWGRQRLGNIVPD